MCQSQGHAMKISLSERVKAERKRQETEFKANLPGACAEVLAVAGIVMSALVVCAVIQ